jgi:hypothetical protein
MHGAGPYNMAIAIMNASPIPTNVLTDGKARKKGTVPTANATRIIQRFGGGDWKTFQIAQIRMGKARPAITTITLLTLKGSFSQLKAAHPETDSSDRLSAAIVYAVSLSSGHRSMFSGSIQTNASEAAFYIHKTLGVSRSSRISISVCMVEAPNMNI